MRFRLILFLLITVFCMGSVTAKIMREKKREVNKMSDAGGAEGNGDYQDIAEEMREAAFGYRSDPFSGELTGGAGEGGVTVAPELSSESAIELKEEKPPAVKPPGKPTEKKKPVITRAKRRRSLLTEEEGGVLRKPTVYRRSILGR